MALYTLDDAGLEVAGSGTILEEVLKAYLADPDSGGFGPTADISPDSPFYKIASPVTQQTASVLQALRDLTAQFDPQTAFGLQLDRLGSLIGLRRRGATRSTIPGRLVGTPNVLVVAGAVLRYLPTGSLWQLSADATIGLNGQVDVEAFALDFGPVDAPSAFAVDWQIVTGQVLGWTSFYSTEAAGLGALKETDVEFRARFAEAAEGLCTYEAIVNKLRLVTNVTRVFLYVNKALTFDVDLQLEGKQMRAVLQGGRKDDIIAALHASLGAPVDTAGAVTGTVDPGNGQILEYAYDRTKRRRCYLKLTITGGNPQAPLPANAEDLILEAVGLFVATIGPFIPYLYGLAAVAALPAGSVTKMKAEGRLDPGDPWVEDAILLGIAEEPSVSIEPTAAVAVANSNAFVITAGDEFKATIDGGVGQIVTFPEDIGGSVNAAAVLGDPIDGLEDVVVEVIDGFVVIHTVSTGGSSSIQLDGGDATAALFDDPTALFEGSDDDVTVVIVP